MDFDRNSMTVPVQSSDYTNKFLQKDSNPTTMEVVTQTNAVKSPTDSPATTKLVYTVEEIARMLAISLRSAYNLCNSTTEFRVLRVGGSIRVPRTASMRGSTGQLDKRRQTVWHILRSVATLTASATPTKMNTARAATNGKVFLQKRRQRTERSRSNMNWQLAHS